MIDYLIENKEWIFSGVGVALLSALVALLLKRRKTRSTHVEIGRDASIGKTESSRSKIIAQNIEGNVITEGDKIDHLTIFTQQEKKVSDLRLVDVGIEEPERAFPKLDIKLRNLGTEVVFLKKGVFRIIDRGILRNPQLVSYKLVPVSWNYEILLGEERYIERPISQAIEPNTADRFTFTLAHSGGDPVYPTLFCIELSLVYDEDNKSLISKPIVLPVPSTTQWAGFVPYGYDEAKARQNMEILKRFATYEGILSEKFLRMIKENT
jgi:hypothetical protein